ncbi:carbohydrate ABC transporter permease [Glycomyces albidus]|jgi:multiple sugar transport system permease protein|uniref:ABC transporter permease subunit n=1 Tax=Glycomyces albidus TaxID=2656774 RepID=A0A6L5G7C1_9ACTN|nr:sugar ABC transporter permease [Glycomyces albidus]MQM25550.1 ABC transporter permease subunit [Glycomyces albidus]
MTTTSVHRTGRASDGAAGPRPAAPAPERRARKRAPGSASTWTAIGFAAPLLAYLAVFYAYPLWRNIELSLHDYTVRSFVLGDPAFVGFEKYAEVFTANAFPTALVNTALFTLVSIAFQYAIGLGLARFFHANFRLSAVLRALFLVPWLLPLIVSSSTWAWMLNSDHGIVNSVVQAFGGEQINWLTSPDTALTAVIIANIWLGIPFNLVILHAGLQQIPGEVYEAAALDGASPRQQFWRITFPLLRPVSAITLLLGFIYTLKVVDVIWIMTTGGPGNASLTLAVWSYREAFGTGQPDFSPAAAIGNLLIVIALVFGFIHVRMQRSWEKS